MKRFFLLGGLLITFFLWVPGLMLAADTRLTDGKDQSAVEITIYNSNIGLVKDHRKISLGKGTQELRFMDVASQVIPSSVSIKSLSRPDSLSVLEQNYEYDLLNPGKLLDKYVGKEVKLVTKNLYTDKEETVTAMVLSNDNGVPIYRINNEITFSHPGRILFPGLPENLIPKPTLVWLLNSTTDATQDIEALYLTNGINWQADYVLLLNAKETMAGLSGWVTIDNKSGAAYRDARLKLVAGDIHRVEEYYPAERFRATSLAVTTLQSQFKEDAFFEYHIYKLERKATIKENQTKQINFLEAENVPVRKEFIYRGAQYYFQDRHEELQSKDKVAVFIEISNRKEDNLGTPLPKGTIRVYKLDSDGSSQFVGEDRVEHTRKDEKVRARLGYAFDIGATRKQTQWEKISKDTYEVAFEITLKNHKKEDITVKVVEPLPGDWKVLESSLPYKKEDANTIFFDVPAKKDGEVKLSYRVRVRF